MTQRKFKLTCFAALVLASLGAQAATINIHSRDPAGVGFNDPTPTEPVGGNPGKTLGEQRYNVYRFVADIWEKQLDSAVPIEVSAGWEALSCTATSATLGSAGAWNIWRDFPNAPKPNTWYPQALANKLAKTNLSDEQEDDGTGYGNVDIKTQFNANLGSENCLAGSPFYLGLDGLAGDKVNFVETLLHELGHGLGFAALTTSGKTGARLQGIPSVWEAFMYDNSVGKTWLDMTDVERQESGLRPLQLAWTGPNAVTGAAVTLSRVPLLNVTSPAPGVAGTYEYSLAAFGPAPTNPGKLGPLAIAGELACAPLSPAAAAAVKGKVALIDRGSCTFVSKAKVAQDAGAIGVVIANNVAGAGAPGMSGEDLTLVIPTVGVSLEVGAQLKAGVLASAKFGSRSTPGTLTATLSTDKKRLSGADKAGRPLLYTPNPYESGSSVSHWDVSASPNLLMEPRINSDLTTTLVAPKDLTFLLLKDLGW